MKILVVSDIHANREAFEAVLASADGLYQGFLCLGDSTGYGPDPEACIQLLREIQQTVAECHVLAGNHDAALFGALSLSWFNPGVRFDIERTRKLLSAESIEWLSRLPSQMRLTANTLAVHGSPREPLTGYLLGGSETDDALLAMLKATVNLCFCGHTHEVALFSVRGDRRALYPVPGETESLRDGPVIINPGSVGFPRLFNAARRPDVAPGGKKIKQSNYPAYYALWDTENESIVFLEARYDRRPMEKKLRLQSQG